MTGGIAALVSRRAHEAPGDVAIVQGRTGRVLTWQALAAGLHRRASARGPVILREPDPLAFISSYLGLLAAGAVVVPVDPQAPEAELDGLADTFGAADPGSVVLRTSGTTGVPKGVPLDEARLLHAAALVAGHHRLSRADTMYSPLPLFHVNAQVVGVLACLVSGARLVVEDRFHRHGFWDVVETHRVTVLNVVPAIIAILAEEPAPAAATAERIRFARSASAPMPVATAERFERATGVGILETYGMTEAAGQICANPLEAAARRPGSVGRPVGIELRIVDDGGAPCPPGAVGRVEIRGPTVASHYLVAGTPARRVPALDPHGWLRTGDVGSVEDDGFVVLMGRVDGVINRGGEKIYPREVEEVLRRHAGVAQAAVVGEADPILGERPVAFVVARDVAAAEGLVAELVALCDRELSRPRRPARIELIERLPATATGKGRADALRALVF